MTINELIRMRTIDYLAQLDPDCLPSPSDIESELVSTIKKAVVLENQNLSKTEKLTAPQKLCASQIALVMLHTHNIVRVKTCEGNVNPDYDLLAIYKDNGVNEGIYVTDETEFKRVAHSYNFSITSKELHDVMEMLLMHAPRVSRTMDRDLIAVNNGIFNFKTKILEPFSPDYVFMVKSKVNYNPFAKNVVIHNDEDGTNWDIESWMEELFDDPELTQLMWEILSAIIRPFVKRQKMAVLYAQSGNNGKGSLCELMRALIGEGSYASLSLSDFGTDFLLEPLIRANAIIRDENDVGTFVDKAANLKAVITNDVISINRKHKTPISYQFYGFMVQCLNEFPRIKDKSDSFYRRQLFIPFDKCFTGKERKYIKERYLHMDTVLEFVLFRILNMNFYSLSEPTVCRLALAEFKEFNDPVRQFLDEMLEQLVWDMIPFSFLHDLFKSWSHKNNPNGSIQGKNTFINDVVNMLGEYPEWYCQDRKKALRPRKRMDKPEPLIVEYGLEEWKNPSYMGGDIDRICTPKLKQSYRGLLRTGCNDDADDTDD
ncbi:DNA primase family protein [Anaerosporobacter sp.]|uniref:DNA primase family protein n=1 Tax=Anaerosporobacter sp. TaxID=1872529 RepID=UPI00286EFD5F|nr:phage/plasmid primase, P4 family [Anaerosporobacter sp.]